MAQTKNYIEIDLKTFKEYFQERDDGNTSSHRNQYLTKEKNKYVVADNRHWDFFVEEFNNRKDAIEWLEEDF